MAHIKTFRDLKVWQKAHTLVLYVYRITSAYPRDEIFGLRSQSRRAAHSVASNIVEGFRRKSLKDSLNFYNKSDASLEELKYHLLVGKDLDYLSNDVYNEAMERCENVGASLTRWMQTQEKFLKA